MCTEMVCSELEAALQGNRSTLSMNNDNGVKSELNLLLYYFASSLDLEPPLSSLFW
jgi:hypothetical protein